MNERDGLLLLNDKLGLLEFLIIYVDKDITDYFVEVIINKKSLASMILTRLFVAGVGPEPTTSGL